MYTLIQIHKIGILDGKPTGLWEMFNSYEDADQAKKERINPDNWVIRRGSFNQNTRINHNYVLSWR